MSTRLYCNEDMQTRGETFDCGDGVVGVYTHRAPDKETANEDSVAAICLGNSSVLAIADGLGGMPRGDQASATAINLLKRCLVGERADNGGFRENILDGFENASRDIAAMGVGAASTLVAAEINNDILRPYHVGDSLIMVVGQRGKIKLLTISHSPIGYAVEAGFIDEQDAMHHEERHIVSNVLGYPDMRIDIGPPIRLARYDTVLLGSDGLFDNLNTQEIVERVRKDPVPVVLDRLANDCLERMQSASGDTPSKPDDLSFVVYRRNA